MINLLPAIGKVITVLRVACFASIILFGVFGGIVIMIISPTGNAL